MRGPPDSGATMPTAAASSRRQLQAIEQYRGSEAGLVRDRTRDRRLLLGQKLRNVAGIEIRGERLGRPFRAETPGARR